MNDVRLLWDGKATLGEGPAWDPHANMLWFVDIKQKQVHRFDPATDRLVSWNAPAQIGWVLPTGRGDLIAGLQTGLALFDPEKGSFDLIVDAEPDLPTNRLNDATVDADGSIWFGSMDDGESAITGQVYRWDGARVSQVGFDAVAITNGPALSPDGTVCYHVDTLGGTIHAGRRNAEGQIVSINEFARIDPADGHPDGVSCDSAGNVWLGLWGGGRARLYSPDGQIIREVAIPAPNVTKVALGGPDMKTAFVTTARAGLGEAALEAQPLAGALFAFQVDVPGNPLPPARVPIG